MFRIVLSRRRSAMIHRCAAGVAGLVIGGAYASGQTNLLLDPGFEAGIAGSPNAATGDVPASTAGPWFGWNNWVPPYSSYYTTSVAAHSGTQVGKTFSGPFAGIYQFASVTAGEAFTASAWFVNSSTDAMTLGQTDDVRMTFFDGPNGTGNDLGLVISSATVTMNNTFDTWTQITVQAAAPANTQSIQWMAFFNNPAYTGGSMFVDDTSLLDTSWNGLGPDNNWSTNNNWGGVSPGQYAPLVFAGNQRLNNTNDFPAATPFYGIAFQPSAGSFTLNGNQVNLASDVVNNSSNSQTIALALGLQQNTNFNTAAGDVSVSGAIGGAFAVTKLGAHTLTLSGANTYSGGTTVTAGKLLIEPTGPTTSALPTGALSVSGSGVVQLADNVTAGTVLGTSNVNITSLTLTGTGTLDIGNNRVIIDYTPGNDPIASIATWIHNGFYGLPGPAITSSDVAAADAASGLSYGIGYADGADGAVAGLPSGEIELMFTLLGDANLDGTVNTEDFTPFSTHLGQNGSWDEGDFNYDGTVNTEDFTPFSSNLNQSASLAAAAGSFVAADGISLANVPEPASATLLLVGAASLLSRRSRKRFGSR